MRARFVVLVAVLLVGFIFGVVAVAGAFSTPARSTALVRPSDTRVAKALHSAERHHASAVGAFSVSIQAIFDSSGNPWLVANFAPNGALATPTWEICPPGTTACAPATSKGGSLRPGREPAGTRFVASATYDGQTYSASAIWRGQVTSLTSPTLSGTPQINHVLVPVAGTWSGGWGSDLDQLGVEACRYASGNDCDMLGGGELGCPDNSSRTHVGGWFTGWYVFAIDARYPRDEACAGTGYSANAGLPLWPLGATVTRSAALGVIAGPPRPTERIFHRLGLRGGEVEIAVLDCRTVCRVSLEVLGKVRGVSRHESFTGKRTITIPREALPPGKVTVYLYIDDSPQITAKSVLP